MSWQRAAELNRLRVEHNSALAHAIASRSFNDQARVADLEDRIKRLEALQIEDMVRDIEPRSDKSKLLLVKR